MTKKNEIATTEEKAVVAVSDNVTVDIAKEDMMIPFLKVIQSLSDEVMPGKDKYNDAIRPGDIYDSVTMANFKDAKAIICGLKKYYAEWTPEVRGQLLGKHPANSPTVLNAIKEEKTTDKGGTFYSLKTTTGNDLVETYGVVMILQTKDGLVLPGVLTLSKTSFMVGKQLSTMLAIRQMNGTPVFTLSTTSVSNTKGSWFKPTFTFDSYATDSSLIDMAKGMVPIVDKILFGNNAGEGESVVINDDDDTLI